MAEVAADSGASQEPQARRIVYCGGKVLSPSNFRQFSQSHVGNPTLLNSCRLQLCFPTAFVHNTRKGVIG
jgi:hypothetical protein